MRTKILVCSSVVAGDAISSKSLIITINGKSSIIDKSCRPGMKISDDKTKCSEGLCVHPVNDPRGLFCDDVARISDNRTDDDFKMKCKVVEDCYKKKACSADEACKCLQNLCEERIRDNCEKDNVCPLSKNSLLTFILEC